MTFASPFALVLLLVAPFLVVAYLLLLRRRRRFAVNFSSLSLIREALPGRSMWRRRVPFALFLLSMMSLAVAAARPQAVVAVPISRTSIILAMDVSRSMCATDVAPNRLTVSQQVARSFIADQPADTRIGVVAFSGLAQLVVPPTTDRKALTGAVDAFTAGRGTAIGSALLRSLDAISEINPNVIRSGVDLSASRSPGAKPDKFEPDIVVLLTDGATTQGVDPLIAANQAADRHVRVYTIGFGTAQGGQIVCTREQMGSDVFTGGFGGGGGGFGADATGQQRRPGLIRDEQTLKKVADITGGAYYRAEDADQLVKVFRNLPTQIALQEQEIEVSAGFAGLGALLAILAVGLSLAWNRYG